MPKIKKAIFKVAWRVSFIIKSLPYILMALLTEPTRHPWRYIFDYWVLPANKRYAKSRKYIESGKLLGLCIKEKTIRVADTNIDISNIKDEQGCLLGVIAQYFDFIYPTKVKYAIPFFISEGAYEKDGCVLKEGDTIIDAGANLGLFTWTFKSRFGDLGKSYLFEPMAEIQAVLEKTIDTSQYTNIYLEKTALSNKIGFTTFNFDSFGGGGHEQESGEKVALATLDSIVEARKIEKVDYIKADIEGMEPFLLKGGRETIKKWKPRIAICTYHDKNHLAELTAILSEIRPDYKFSHSSHKLFAW